MIKLRGCRKQFSKPVRNWVEVGMTHDTTTNFIFDFKHKLSNSQFLTTDIGFMLQVFYNNAQLLSESDGESSSSI